MSLGTDLKTLIARADTADGDLVISILERIDEEGPETVPFSEDMPADGLRAAYENYHAQVRRLERLLGDVRMVAGFVAERAADVIKLGGEI